MLEVFLEGALLQASLIFALGAQNLFVLESGLKRQHPITVSLICFVCDFVIIMLGVAGAATFFTQFPQLKIFIGIVGVLFLFHYGLGKIFSKPSQNFTSQNFKLTRKASILSAISFSVLNPHAYLDGIVLIGGFSSKFQDLETRMMFGFGAAFFSGIWFLFLSTTSGLVKDFFANTVRMRKLMCVTGVTLMLLSAKLSIDVLDWMKGLKYGPSNEKILSSIDLFKATGIF